MHCYTHYTYTHTGRIKFCYILAPTNVAVHAQKNHALSIISCIVKNSCYIYIYMKSGNCNIGPSIHHDRLYT